MPVIYVNDHFGKWHSSFEKVYAHCTRASSLGKGVSRMLKPKRSDFFVLKPRHSGFHHTSLTLVLEDLMAKRLILTGIATNLCVLFTAHDAHMNRYPLIVLSDCCAAETGFDHNVALTQLERFCGATICRSTDFRFTKRSR
jgi:nicotinamidase-related amidase